MRRKETRPRIRFNRDLLEPLVKSSKSFTEVARKLNYPDYSLIGAVSRIAKKVREFEINYEHFDKLFGGAIRRPDEEIFCIGSRFSKNVHRKRLIEKRGESCEKCKTSDWLGKPLVMDVHHLNEDNTDNRFENLVIVCPNCHRSLHRR